MRSTTWWHSDNFFRNKHSENNWLKPSITRLTYNRITVSLLKALNLNYCRYSTPSCIRCFKQRTLNKSLFETIVKVFIFEGKITRFPFFGKRAMSTQPVDTRLLIFHTITSWNRAAAKYEIKSASRAVSRGQYFIFDKWTVRLNLCAEFETIHIYVIRAFDIISVIKISYLEKWKSDRETTFQPNSPLAYKARNTKRVNALTKNIQWRKE